MGRGVRDPRLFHHKNFAEKIDRVGKRPEARSYVGSVAARQTPRTTAQAVRVVLTVDREAVLALADRLGEIAADLWLAGAFDLDDENTLTDVTPREIVTGT